MRLPKHIWNTLESRGWKGMHHLDARDQHGASPLAYAFAGSHDLKMDTSLVHTLLQAGANPLVKDNHGQNLWFSAYDVFQAGPLLMELGVNPNETNAAHQSFPCFLMDHWRYVASLASYCTLHRDYQDPSFKTDVLRQFIEWQIDLSACSADVQPLIQQVTAEIEQQHLQTTLNPSSKSMFRNHL